MAGNTSEGEEVPATGEDGQTLDAVEAEFQRKIEDVRERVIQVKRQTDTKAPADHDHEELRTALEELEADVESLRTDVTAVRADVDTGFENFEAILESLTDRTDTLADRTERLAGAVLDLRRAVEALAENDADPIDPILRTANREGIRDADCETCGNPVDLALLREPECPHCGATFSDVRPSTGWFGSATLVVGDPPALEPAAEDDIADHGLEDIAEDDDD